MAAVKKRLDELVADAQRRHLRSGAVRAWYADLGQESAAAFSRLARVVADEAVAAAGRGDYTSARKLADLGEVYLPSWAAGV
jgi:hypothetical protein